MSKICLCWAEIGMNGSFSKGAEYLNCNDHLTARGQKHVDSTAGYLPVYSPRLLLILMSLAVPKGPRKDYFSSQSVKWFLFRVKCDWFRVIEKFGAKYCGRKQSSSLEPFEFSLGSRCRRRKDSRNQISQLFSYLLISTTWYYHVWWRFIQVLLECKESLFINLFVLDLC